MRQQLIVAICVFLVGWCLQCIVGSLQQTIVEYAAFRRQRNAALFYFTEAGSMVPVNGAAVMLNEIDVFLQRFKAGLAQQDRASTRRWPFNHRFGSDAPARHCLLNQIDIKGARRQVVNVRAFERDHVSNQTVLVVQLLIFGCADRRPAVPTEGFQRLLDKFVGLVLVQPTLGFLQGDQLQCALGKYSTTRQQLLRQLT
ncbi:hypothetical protein D3C72_1149380 [compost metagenome]